MRRYGEWAGNRAGVAEDPSRCIEGVWRGHREYQCARARGHGAGGAYCRQHARMHERHAEMEARLDARWGTGGR